MFWGAEENKNWGTNGETTKKIKQTSGAQQLFAKGNWGLPDTKNMGLQGVRFNDEQKANIGRITGKMKMNREV